MQDRIKQEQTRMKLNSDMEKFWSIEMKVIAVFTVPNVSHAYKEAAAIQWIWLLQIFLPVLKTK